MNKYSVKISKEIKTKLKLYWKLYKKLNGKFHRDLYSLEKKMEKDTGIKNIEFFFCDNECAGIGNSDRSMKLIHGKELE